MLELQIVSITTQFEFEDLDPVSALLVLNGKHIRMRTEQMPYLATCRLSSGVLGGLCSLYYRLSSPVGEFHTPRTQNGLCWAQATRTDE